MKAAMKRMQAVMKACARKCKGGRNYRACMKPCLRRGAKGK